MSKSSLFTGQPIFSQILNLIPRALVDALARQFQSDYYYKKFDTYHHLVVMLFGVFNQCTSLREITTGILAWEQKINHLGLSHYPRRSTLSDANNHRCHEVFGAIYFQLLELLSQFLPDSRSGKEKNLYIIDSTVFTLFSEIMRGTGRENLNGQRKGGIKAHMVINSAQDMPTMVWFSEAKNNDSQFLKLVNLPKGSVILFDRGYKDFTTYNRFTEQGITWVTRLRKRTVFETEQYRDIDKDCAEQGIEQDSDIIIGNHHHKTAAKVNARLIRYTDPQSRETLEFITNNRLLSSITIADYYKKRWQIETLFKRLKQNFPLKYFLGDSENAIKIQIWCALIADLLLKAISNMNETKMAYSNVVSLVRQHMMTYIDLKTILQSTEQELIKIFERRYQKTSAPDLFSG